MLRVELAPHPRVLTYPNMKEGKRMMQGVRIAICVGTLLALVSGPTVALAKNVCVTDSFGASYIFSQVKSRKPGKILPLTGVRIDALTLAEPVDGTAVVLSDGTVNIGVWAHSMSPISANDVLWVLKGADADFNGTGRFDNNGDYSSDGPVTWTSADCATITIP